MEKTNRIISVELSPRSHIYVEVSPIGNVSQDISTQLFSFNNIENTIKDICSRIGNAIEQVKPDKAIVEFDIELSVESGVPAP